MISKPLAATQPAAAEIATFWLADGGANLTAATPYNVRTSTSKLLDGGGATPDTKPGTIPPSLPATTSTAAAVTPATSGKVFFLGADGLPHWCTGTAVHSQYRNVVATAAHCGFDIQRTGYALDKWAFVPAYTNGTAPLGLYVGRQLYGHYDFDAYGDFDRGYAFITVYEGVAPSATGEPVNFGRLGDNAGGQGLAWNQPVDSATDVFGYPAGPHPDGTLPYTGDTLESSSGRPTSVQVPSLKGEELLGVGSPFTGEGALGSSWLLRYDKATGQGYLNGVTISVTDRDADLRFDTSMSPYFDGETRSVYTAAATQWTGAVLPT
ncbi:hypothetical protein HCN51_01865 [Nonomuraea sp. FMUSA5-5]|uniref:Trypsin-like serine protease n=1 Tax=Nonomuraea composti TaxID=2720023 RepID=A0ABX1ARE3_9ACTN|nr:hypothetical protein [Nonomuraea sp. FMUSA5-5]